MTPNRNEPRLAPHYLLVVDEDTRQFSILGPCADTNYFRERAAKEQGKGRKLTLETAQGNDAVTISRLVKSTGFDYTVTPLL
jgi:hypothetical protein